MNKSEDHIKLEERDLTNAVRSFMQHRVAVGDRLIRHCKDEESK